MKQLHVEEVWVELDSFPDYAISNYGRVVNIRTNKDLTLTPDKDGALRVSLYNQGKRSNNYVHRLVAKCFFLNYSEGHAVKHINGNKTDNSVLNLTLSEEKVLKGKNTWTK